MVNREANLKEVFIKNPDDNITYSYIVPNGIFYEMQRLENALRDANQQLADTEARLEHDEFEFAQRIIFNLNSDKAGTSKSMLTQKEFSALDDYYGELESRIVQALRGNDPYGNKVPKNRLGRTFGAADKDIEKRRRKAGLMK